MTLLLVMLVVLCLVTLGTALLMAHAILRPPRMTDGKAIYLLKRLSPADLQMPFQPLVYTVPDQRTNQTLDLAAWWIPHPAGGERTVVLIHGYADAKVGAIAWAPTWRELGYHILAIDLQAHGESGGKYCTGGVLESADLAQILDQLRCQRPAQTRKLVLFGISLGAAVALSAAERRDDVAALVLECPAANFHSAVREYTQTLQLPLKALMPLALWFANKLCGADLGSIDPAQSILRARCPVMVIQSGDDQFVAPEDAQAIESAVQQRSGQSVCWRVPGVSHLLALQADPEEYRGRIDHFLNKLAL